MCTLLMGNARRGVFFKRSQIFGQKIRGLKYLGENLRGLKSISKFDLIFFKISIFSEADPNIAKIVTISEITKADKIKNSLILEPHSRKFLRKYD